MRSCPDTDIDPQSLKVFNVFVSSALKEVCLKRLVTAGTLSCPPKEFDLPSTPDLVRHRILAHSHAPSKNLRTRWQLVSFETKLVQSDSSERLLCFASKWLHWVPEVIFFVWRREIARREALRRKKITIGRTNAEPHFRAVLSPGKPRFS